MAPTVTRRRDEAKEKTGQKLTSRHQQKTGILSSFTNNLMSLSRCQRSDRKVMKADASPPEVTLACTSKVLEAKVKVKLRTLLPDPNLFS